MSQYNCLIYLSTFYYGISQLQGMKACPGQLVGWWEAYSLNLTEATTWYEYFPRSGIFQNTGVRKPGQNSRELTFFFFLLYVTNFK